MRCTLLTGSELSSLTPLRDIQPLEVPGGVEQVHYQGRLGVKRRDRWTWRVASNADGHLCRSCARVGCCFGHIRHLVGPWGCSRRWLGTGRATGLSTDILGCREAPLVEPEKVLSITRKWGIQAIFRALQRSAWTGLGMYMSRQVHASLPAIMYRYKVV